jgi:uncharacterized membrane protein
MSELPQDLLVVAFDDEGGADNALKALEAAKEEHNVGIHNAALIRRDADNTLHIREMAAWSAGTDSAAGVLIGGAIGLLFPPRILVSGALGATIGGMAALLTDSGLPDARLKELGATLRPGTSALIALVEREHGAELERQLGALGARTVREGIQPNMAAQLEQGRAGVPMPRASTEGIIAIDTDRAPPRES